MTRQGFVGGVTEGARRAIEDLKRLIKALDVAKLNRSGGTINGDLEVEGDLTNDGRDVVTAASGSTVVQSGRLAGATDANGLITLTFPVAFSSGPTMVLGVRGGTDADATCTRASYSTTGAVFACRNNGTLLNSVNVTIEWIAVGPV